MTSGEDASSRDGSAGFGSTEQRSVPGAGHDAAPEPSDRRLRLDGVSVRFGGIVALDRVSLTAAAGEVLGIIGPNGAGKTTLFDVIAGVRAPSEGAVSLDGRDITRAAASTRARAGLRRTFQRVQTFGWLTVEDNVLTAIEWRSGGGGFIADVAGVPGRRRRERERRERVSQALHSCGLYEIRGELASSLPIGTARMVELARAIVDEPTVLLLDEPASGLDETEMCRLGERIQSVHAEIGCAVLLVEHNAEFVMQHCSRIVVLDQGCVLAEGRPDEIQRNQAVRDAYLGDVSAETSLANVTERASHVLGEDPT
jgi:branched-chain amino acid transport system ATP-binding protein